ncbi:MULTISPECIES: hypothetical protein [unclassified Cobetia]|uniref:hypothetical protein n=1 Tax=unclassified Cobetia TaxID=2609414 RepID=UPI00159E4164|nr:MULTISPECIES: hypothetical protein [unclassified Cobetia]MCO7232668.1 hypothetical protein [Cobetia sp. Dlab-2-AX]MCO7235942.1 hypothetical protein [Cobetia sp. Dlab-2-U]NVN54711.1 hypothetical protein [bacterium Scap17]
MKTHRSTAATSLRHLAEHAAIVRHPVMNYARIDSDTDPVSNDTATTPERQREIQREAMEHVAMLLERDRRRTRNRLLLAAGLLLSLVLLASQRPAVPEAAFSQELGQAMPSALHLSQQELA